MEMRTLRSGDFKGLTDLILGVYRDTRISMWFDFEPTQRELEELFRYKIDSVGCGRSVDLIAVEEGRIIGECEILLAEEVGVVGIIVEKGERKKGLGTKLFNAAVEIAGKLGAKKFFADVASENTAALEFFKKLGFKRRSVQAVANTENQDEKMPLRLELVL